MTSLVYGFNLGPQTAFRSTIQAACRGATRSHYSSAAHSRIPLKSFSSPSAPALQHLRAEVVVPRLQSLACNLQPSSKHNLLKHSSVARNLQKQEHSQSCHRLRMIAAEATGTCGDGVMGGDEPCPKGYRPNVGVCLVNADDKVFVANRLDLASAWQMPQGGIDEGESAAEAAIRELREETGVTSADIIGQVPRWMTYDFPPDVRAKLRVIWGQDWNGQAQKWFLFRLTGDESEVNLLGDGSEKPEFSEYKWVDPDWVVKKAAVFKRGVYEQVIEEFSKVIPSFKLPRPEGTAMGPGE